MTQIVKPGLFIELLNSFTAMILDFTKKYENPLLIPIYSAYFTNVTKRFLLLFRNWQEVRVDKKRNTSKKRLKISKLF